MYILWYGDCYAKKGRGLKWLKLHHLLIIIVEATITIGVMNAILFFHLVPSFAQIVGCRLELKKMFTMSLEKGWLEKLRK
jgi:hypothetical protein